MSELKFWATIIGGVIFIFLLLRSAGKGYISVGKGKGYKPGKDEKPLGLLHFFRSALEGLNPAKNEDEPLLDWSSSKILKKVKFFFWAPNWIWKHWWPDNAKGKTLLRVKVCTVIFWIIAVATFFS